MQNLKQIKGYISDAELEFLFSAAQKTNGNILEIGSWQGRSTIALALGSKSGFNSKVYSVDCEYFEEFYDNLKKFGVEDIVKQIIQTEQTLAKEWNLPIFLFFVDLYQDSYEEMENLMKNWLPHLSEGGVIVFNNVAPNFQGIFERSPLWGYLVPKKIGKKYILNSGYFKNCGLAGTILYGTKCSRINFWGKIRNRLVSWKIDFYSFLFKIYLILRKIPFPAKRKIKSFLLKALKIESIKIDF